MADALNIPVSVMATAGEGGPWGVAVLAAYTLNKADNQRLEDYLEKEVFANQKATVLEPEEFGKDSFASYMERYKDVLLVERAAIDNLK